jgi:hypothetical protein
MKTMKTEGYTPIDRARAEELLATATQLQAAFWDALSELEGALDGIEISGTRDLSETTIEELMEEAEVGRRMRYRHRDRAVAIPPRL